MRVLAARFPDRQRASAALDALKRRLHLAADAAAIAPLGTPGRGAEADAVLLAGHFREDQTGLVRSVVSRSGGEVVADVDESWTRPRSYPATPAAPRASSMNRVRLRERARLPVVP